MLAIPPRCISWAPRTPGSRATHSAAVAAALIMFCVLKSSRLERLKARMQTVAAGGKPARETDSLVEGL